MKNKIIVLVILILMMCGCDMGETYDEYLENNTSQHTGKCLEYKTEYKLDCGLWVDSENFCKERKYDVCVRWEDNVEEVKNEDER